MPLSKEQIERIKKEAVNYKSAVDQIGKASTELWKARIDMSIAAGGVESIDDLVKPGGAVAWGEIHNGNCGCDHKMPTDIGRPTR